MKSFEVGLGKDLSLVCKRATVVLGHDGTDVLWAVVLPDKPPKITGALEQEGETAATIVLRFSPYEVGRIFPAATIAGRGDGWHRHEASRIARRKMVWKWCTPAGNPTIVPKPVTVVDVDTVEGPRRFWAIDRDAAKVTRVDDFTDQATPTLKPLDSRAVQQAFDEVWQAFDKEYAGFVTLPKVDWDALGKRYRKSAGDARSAYAVAAELAELLAHLEDLHVWVKCGDEHLAGYTRERPLNGNWKATRARLTEAKEGGGVLVRDDVGGDAARVGSGDGTWLGPRRRRMWRAQRVGILARRTGPRGAPRRHWPGDRIGVERCGRPVGSSK